MAVSAKTHEEKITRNTLDFAKEKMINLPPSHDWQHILRVMRLAERIADTEISDIFIVRISAILHDIAREIENRNEGKLCHAEIGSAMAYDFLIGQGLDEQRAKKISDCIKSHRYRKNAPPSSIEAKILYDADKLDSIGAIGIGRAFLFSGEIGAKLHNPDIDISLTEAYGAEDTAYREYIVKLRHIYGKMLTSEGKRIARERHDFMELFFNRLKSEFDGEK